MEPQRVAGTTGAGTPARDLDDAAEIEAMVRRFYADVAQDDLLGPIFNDVAQVDWSTHIPKLTAFWCRILLSQPGYEGNPLRKHEQAHEQAPFTPAHFERWLALFRETVELAWAGPRADHALAFAERVALVHSRHLLGEPVSLDRSGPDGAEQGVDAPSRRSDVSTAPDTPVVTTDLDVPTAGTPLAGTELDGPIRTRR